MTYILNAVCIGLPVPLPFRSGSILAEVDEPQMKSGEALNELGLGVHYLVVVDNGSGYTSSDELVQVPDDPDQPALLRVPTEFRDDAMKVLGLLARASPASRLIVYLEANRAMTRQDPDEPHPIAVRKVTFESLEDFWRAERDGRIEEECLAEISVAT